MSPDTTESIPPRAGQYRSTLQLVAGLALLAYGIALWMDLVTYTPPAGVYLAVGVVLLVYGFVRIAQA